MLPHAMLVARLRRSLRLHATRCRSLTRVAGKLGKHATRTPVEIVMALTHPTMKRRPRPIAHSFHKLMTDRIEMNVIEMILEILIIDNHVLPKTTLPNSPPPLLPTRRGTALFLATGGQPIFCKLAFDPAPTQRIVT